MGLELVQQTVTQLEKTVEKRLKEISLDKLIRYYLGVHFIHKKAKEIKDLIKSEVEGRLRKKKKDKYSCIYGTASITHPTTKVLDREAWESALQENDRLKRLHDSYREAEEIFTKAQEPYMKDRDGWLIIR